MAATDEQLGNALRRALRTMEGLQGKLLMQGYVPGSDKLGASRRMEDLDESIRVVRSTLAGRCKCIRPVRAPYTSDRCTCGEALP
jgi:hypothetical protein